MNTLTINGVVFNDFGQNNYSYGMKLISVYPAPENIVEDVLAGKYPGVFLNPSAPCNTEFFGVYGTDEQYKDFYQRQREAQISKRTMEILGGFEESRTASLERFKAAQEQAVRDYRDWWLWK